MQFLLRFHRMLLNLYPKEYREEYGEELLMVFNLVLGDAFNRGRRELAETILHELLGLPKAIIHEHLRERSKKNMTGKFASRFDFEFGSRNEALAAVAPFLLAVLMVFISLIGRYMQIPYAVEVMLTLLFIGSLLSLFVFGFLKSIPRWFLPYLGLPLPILCILIFNAWIDPEWPGFVGIPWLAQQFVGAGFIWGPLILLAMSLVVIFASVKKFQPLYQNLRKDWTLLSFLLYGSIPFLLVVSFEGFINDEVFLVLAFLFLGAGGWLYLRNENPLKKFLSLFAGLTLSMAITALGQTVLYVQSFPNSVFPWWTTTLATVVLWVWLTLILLTPLALNLIPRAKDKSLAV